MTAMTSTAYSRDLGDELRRLREKFAGLTGFAFAEQLGWDPSKVSNIENGKARASEIDLVQYLLTCGRDSVFLEKKIPVAYSETDLAKVFAHDGSAIARSREFFKWLDARALDEGQSRSLLANYVSKLRKDLDEPRPELA